MGRVLRGERRPASDYAMGVFLAAGASLFFLSTHVGSTIDYTSLSASTTALSGILLMSGYLFFDAFTLNWQKKLFDTSRPKISRYQVSRF